MSIQILDTHQHLLYTGRLRYPVAETVPALANRGFLYEDYLAAIEGTGIEASLFMETTSDDSTGEFELVHALLAQPRSGIAGIVAQCALETAEDFQPWLASRMDRGLRGVRRICHTEPDDFALSDTFVRNVQLLGRLGLTFDLCFLGRQLPYALELAKRCAGTQLILDHCGVPDIAGSEWDGWQAAIASLAELSHVACKISGVLAYCRPGCATLAAVQPYIEHCIARFGWDRLVWGSDWPFCNQTTTVRHWVAVSRALVRDETDENQRKLFHANARRIYGLADARPGSRASIG